jgi:DNA-binding MarR family transcriptional regulator
LVKQTLIWHFLKLEEEIHQKHFKSQQQKLALNLIYTASWLNGKYLDFFRDTDITLQQYNVLRILRGQHPEYCNLKLVKERMLDRMSDTSRIVDKLLAKGFIERKECPSDRRQVNILITAGGLDLLKSLDFIDEEVKQTFKTLSTKQIEILNDLLDELRG